MQKLLTIIVPVYNVEKYIYECLNSIISSVSEENKERLEVIIINDCTPDQSMQNVSDLLNSYKSIFKVINHTENKGLGGARNTGIEEASGKFVTFIDSDDYYNHGAVDRIFEIIERVNENDIIIFGFLAIKNGDVRWEYIPSNDISVSSYEALELFANDKITPAAWNKVYPRTILNKVKFSPHIYYEDLEFTPKAFSESSNIRFYKKHLINYRLDGTSITRQKIKKKHIDDFSFVLNVLFRDLRNHKIFSTIFFNRWAHLLRLWELEPQEFEHALNKLQNQIEKFDLDKINKQYYFFCKAISYEIERFSDQGIIISKYAQLINSLNLEHPFFSIIIPVYNAEKYIKKAVDYYSKQKFWNFELIFIDDCSTDSSIEIIESLQTQFDFIRLERLESNSGAGVARNLGIKKAKGEYMMFNDSDDWFDENGLELLYNHLGSNDFPDFIIFSYSVYDGNDKYLWTNTNIPNVPKKIYTGKEIIKYFCNSTINPSPWNKIFRRNIWVNNKIEFPPEIHHQDLSAIPFACFKGKSGLVIHKPLYNYVTNQQGVTQSVSNNHVSSPFKAIEKLFSFFERDNEFVNWQNELLELAFETFRYNFSVRRHRFIDAQFLDYLELFNEFCKLYKIEIHYIINCRPALKFVTEIIQEKYRRGLKNVMIEPFHSDLSMEKLILHESKINDQIQLILTESIKLERELLEKREKLKLNSINERLVSKIDELENQKAWYSRTYDHLPKWYLKIGGVFRRIKLLSK